MAGGVRRIYRVAICVTLSPLHITGLYGVEGWGHFGGNLAEKTYVDLSDGIKCGKRCPEAYIVELKLTFIVYNV